MYYNILKILNNQNELHDSLDSYDSVSFISDIVKTDENGDYKEKISYLEYRGETEYPNSGIIGNTVEKIYIKNKELKEMNFKEELQTLSENYNSPKLENIKNILKKSASNGERTITIDSNLYDKYVINWLEAQGFGVKETLDQRDGDFIRVSW